VARVAIPDAPLSGESRTCTARLAIAVALSIVFIANLATLILQLVAGRFLAPAVGSSLYTWTSIIGVTLAGISAGNWVGGRWATRGRPARKALWLLLAGALCCALAPVFVRGVAAIPGFIDLDLLVRIAVLTVIGIFPSAFVLAAVTPLMIALSVRGLSRSGQTIGLIYAVSTLGSLFGNYATGFFLTAYFGVTTILWATAAVVAAAAVLLLRIGRTDRLAGAPATDHGTEAHARPAGRGPLALAGNRPLACAIVAAASFATMTVELSASRVLAPSVGLSLYSWTGIIGVVLAAIALGNYLGGVLADRTRSQIVLGLTLLAGAAGVFLILFAATILNERALWGALPLVERILVLTFALFFLPILLLGMVSPQVIRLTIDDSRNAGRLSGEIYAWSTLGAIVGTFVTGWFLISALGVYMVIFAMAAILAVLGVIVLQSERRALPAAASIAVMGAIAFALWSRGLAESRCTMETNYFCIKVGTQDRPGVGEVKTLVLDHLLHSFVKVGDPGYLGYAHEEVQAEITRHYAQVSGPPYVLVIGGGGYTYPRWVDDRIAGARVDVVEIDPGVTRIAYEHFGLPQNTRIRSLNMDGRQFVQALAAPESYDLVVQDAVNDISVPYHIMVKEYNDAVRAMLRPGGAYLLTVIDFYRDGELLRAAGRTLRQSFNQVQLLAAGEVWHGGGANVWVLAGSDVGIDVAAVRASYARLGLAARIAELPAAEFDAYLGEGEQIILTDEYSPVDNLIAGLFRHRN